MSCLNHQMTVLVTEGENRSSLAVTRSLGRYGCKVIVSGEKLKNLASCSKYCSDRYAVPSPVYDCPGYLEAIAGIVTSEDIKVLFPMTEPAVLLLAEHRLKFPPEMILACPELEKIRTVFDKSVVFRLAEELGVAIPRTLFVKNRDDFFQKKTEVQCFPVVVKPSLSKIRLGNGFLSAGVRYADDHAALERLFLEERFLDYPSMIQEKIIGPGTGLFTLFEDSRHLALFSHKRILEKPPSGGVSVVCESVSLDQEMIEASRKLLAAVGWHGVAMVEFKRDERDGRPKLMEINGRFWGSLQLAVASGVDFPVLLLKQVLGEGRLAEVKASYQVGLRMKWFLGTLDHLLIRLRHRDASLNLSPSSASKFGAIVNFASLGGKNLVFDVIDLKDLRPFFCELRGYVKALVSR